MPGPGRKFANGQSGNPGGRKRVPAEVREILDAKTPDMVAKLCAIALDDDHPQQVRALELALDRSLGKPMGADEAAKLLEQEFAGMTEAEIVEEIKRELEKPS